MSFAVVQAVVVAQQEPWIQWIQAIDCIYFIIMYDGSVIKKGVTSTGKKWSLLAQEIRQKLKRNQINQGYVVIAIYKTD